jgi:hypothetical protein
MNVRVKMPLRGSLDDLSDAIFRGLVDNIVNGIAHGMTTEEEEKFLSEILSADSVLKLNVPSRWVN